MKTLYNKRHVISVSWWPEALMYTCTLEDREWLGFSLTPHWKIYNEIDNYLYYSKRLPNEEERFTFIRNKWGDKVRIIKRAGLLIKTSDVRWNYEYFDTNELMEQRLADFKDLL
jgi:hypothetical protein